MTFGIEEHPLSFDRQADISFVPKKEWTESVEAEQRLKLEGTIIWDKTER